MALYPLTTGYFPTTTGKFPLTSGGVFPSDTVAATYASTVLGTTGLVSYWRLGEATPGTGTAVDANAAAHNGTYVASPTGGAVGPLAGNPSTAVVLNGSTQYVTVADDPAWTLATSGELSIEFWVKQTAGANGYFISKGAYEWGIRHASDDPASIFAELFTSGGGSVATVSGGTITAAAWHHIVLTLKLSTTAALLYADGAQVGSQAVWSGSMSNTTQALNIGRLADGTQANNATMAEVAIYSVVLTPTQIAAHFAFHA